MCHLDVWSRLLTGSGDWGSGNTIHQGPISIGVVGAIRGSLRQQ